MKKIINYVVVIGFFFVMCYGIFVLNEKMDKEKNLGYENIKQGMQSYLKTENSVLCFKTELVNMGGRYSSPIYKYTNVKTLMNRDEIKYLDNYFVSHKDDDRKTYHIENCFSYLINKDYTRMGKPRYIGGSYSIGYTERTNDRAMKIKNLIDNDMNIYCKNTGKVSVFNRNLGYSYTDESTITITSKLSPKLIKDYDEYYILTSDNQIFNSMNCFGKKRKNYQTMDIRNNHMYKKKN